jgi:predicted permease
MRYLRAYVLRLVSVFRKRQSDDEFAAEIEANLQMHIEDNLQSGMSKEEARRQALIRLGGLEPTKEIYRERRGLPFIDTLFQDMRFAVRMLRKNRGFTLVAVVTLALGIGVNTAIFSIVYSMLLRPLPYKNSSRMITVHTRTAMFPTFEIATSWPMFQAIRQRATALETAAAYRTTEKTITGQGEPAVLDAANVSRDYFEQLGAKAENGRLLSEEDYKSGQQLVTVISDKLWRTRFASDAAIVGRTLVLDKQIYTVVGVAAKNLKSPHRADLWMPLLVTPDLEQNHTFFMFQILGTLRQGESRERLDAQLAFIAQELVKLKPELGKDLKITSQPLLENTVGDARESYLVLLGATAFVLLIACANLTSLLLARGWGRHREMAMRAALGATSRRLRRQCLVESCLLGLLGGVAGIGVAILALMRFAPWRLQALLDWTKSARTGR